MLTANQIDSVSIFRYELNSHPINLALTTYSIC